MMLPSPKKIVTLFVSPLCDPGSGPVLFNTGMKKTYLQAKPYTVSGAKNRLHSLGTRVSIQASAEQTGGAFNLFDVLLPTGYETALHIHYAEDVAIRILEGALDIFWGEERRQAKVGSFFFQPRGMPHGFRVTGISTARILYMTFPAGFDGFVLERSRSITEAEAIVSEARYKIEVLGTLPA
jgi:mannose-6-phosphate isomerase-like protein (cupin superfamily)